MISDVLFEAKENIEEYQKELPQCYDGSKARIEAIKNAMSCLQCDFDLPPFAQKENIDKLYNELNECAINIKNELIKQYKDSQSFSD